jgi:TRAP-type C4-dicarboxylate transport system substrate-binding protein
LFPDYKKAAEVCDGRLARNTGFASGEKPGWPGLRRERGFRQITNNKREIKSPADLKPENPNPPDKDVY